MSVYKIFISYLILISTAFSDIGQSAIITLTFPYGAREAGMGEVGTGLCSGPGAPFYNPAGLAIPNEDWDGVLLHSFYEPLLPAFQLPDMWHLSISSIMQRRDAEGNLHGMGFNLNFLNFGENVRYNEKGQEVSRFNSCEYVVALSYATLFEKRRYRDIGLGLNVKYVQSALDRTVEGGTARTFAIDVGGLWKYNFGLNVGLMLQNMGPSVAYTNKEDPDPLPFTIRFGLGFDKEFFVENMKLLRIKIGYDLERECVRNEYGKDPDPFYKSIISSWTDQKPFSEELEEIIHHVGGEATIFNIAMFRIGFLQQVAISQKEFNFGFGLNILNHIEANWSYIYSPNFSEFRNGQWRIDLTFKRIGIRKSEDLFWMFQKSPLK